MASTENLNVEAGVLPGQQGDKEWIELSKLNWLRIAAKLLPM